MPIINRIKNRSAARRNYETNDALWAGALVVLVLGVTFWRWGLCALGDDYGWDYETSYRAFLGEKYGRDFFTTVAPFSYFVAGTFYRWFGPHLVVNHLLWYLCWASSLLAALLIVRELDRNPRVLAAIAIVAIPLSIPHLVALHLYNFLSFAEFLWSALLLVKHFQTWRRRYLVAVAGLAAVALFTKQNIGLAIVAVTGLYLAVENWRRRQSPAATALEFASFTLPLVAISGIVFYQLADGIGWAEMARLLFKDGADAKGGIVGMLKTSLPRITRSITPHGWGERLGQHALTIVGYGIIFFLCRNRTRKLKAKLGSSATLRYLPTRTDLIFAAGAVLAVPILSALISPYAEGWTKFRPAGRTDLVYLRAFIVYLVVHAGLILFTLSKRTRNCFADPHAFYWCTGFAAASYLAMVASQGLYAWLGAQLLLAVCLVFFFRTGQWTRTGYRTFALVAVNFVYLFYYPSQLLHRQVPIEFAGFVGLRANRETAREYETFYREMHSLVGNQQTLWLTHGGPHSLSGSIPVRNVSNLYSDQYHARLEPRLLEYWKANPPPRIVFASFFGAAGTYGAENPDLNRWIEENYEAIPNGTGMRVLQRKAP